MPHRKIFIVGLQLALLTAVLVTSQHAFSRARGCIKAKCRSKVSSFYIRPLIPIDSQITIESEAYPVNTQPIAVGYLKNGQIGKNVIFNFGIDAKFTPVSYDINENKRTGLSYALGILLGFSRQYRAKNLLHSTFFRMAFYPYNNFSVKSTTNTTSTIQGETSNITTQTVTTYSGTVAGGLEIGMGRTYGGFPFNRKKSLNYGLILGTHQEMYKTKTEQSLQKIDSQEAVLRSPIESSINHKFFYHYVSLFVSFDV